MAPKSRGRHKSLHPRASVGCWYGPRGAWELLVAPHLPSTAAGRVPHVPQGVWGSGHEAGAASSSCLHPLGDARQDGSCRKSLSGGLFEVLHVPGSCGAARPCQGKDKATGSWCAAWFGHRGTGFGRGESTPGPRQLTGKVTPSQAQAAALLRRGSCWQTMCISHYWSQCRDVS